MGTDLTSSEEKFLKIAKDRFDQARDAESDFRQQALDDLKFRAGEQWPEEVRRAREMRRRPCLTINRIPQFIRQITNDQRQNRPSIKVNPVDNEADVETAKVLQGIIRHIEYNSNADVAYDSAFESAVSTGIGYFRILTQYCDPLTLDQEISIKRIKNPFTVYLDPNYQEPDASDAQWGFIFEDLTREQFEALYPDSKLSSMDDWRSIGDKQRGWLSGESVRVAEYFYKEYKTVFIFKLKDGNVVKVEDGGEQPPDEIVETKKTSRVPTIKWAKINAIETLEETVWPGKWIPIVPVLGDEIEIEGKRILEGVVRHAKDPQRMYNYWASSETETIALAPKAPFIGAEGQFEGHEPKWREANTENHAYLEYKPVDVAGRPVGPPQRNVFEPPVQAITNARMQSADDLKATTGVYDAALGARSNENSGIAIQRRNAQSQTANFHFVDNLSRALRHAGRILVDIIPSIYDTPRAIRIVGEDDEQSVVTINELFQKDGKQQFYDLKKGKYDVTISNGPSYATKRQEALDSMLQLTKAYPQVAQVAGDLMVKYMDWPGAQEIAERIKKTLPPQLTADDKNQSQVPPEMQAQMQQAQAAVEELGAKLAQAEQALQSRAAEKQIEIESRERIELAKLEVQMKIELLKAGSKEALSLFTSEIDQLNRAQENLGFEKEQIEMGADALVDEQNINPYGEVSPENPME